MKEKENPLVTVMKKKALNLYGPEKSQRIEAYYERRYQELCRQNADEPKALKPHTTLKIYPAIAFDEALQKEGLSREEAARFIYEACEEDALPGAQSMKNMLKVPGLYRLMPLGWKIVTRTQFGTAAGFEFHFYDVGHKRVKFDMTKCPYFEICKKYGCPEIVPAFCHTDDINSENIHPRLLWNRTKTLGNGGDCCDFDLIVK